MPERKMQDTSATNQEQHQEKIPISREDKRIIADLLGVKQDTVYQVAAGNRKSQRVAKACYAWLRIKQNAVGQLQGDLATL